MKISKYARREAKERFRACRVDGLLDEARVRASVQQLIEAKTRGYFEVLRHFRRLVKLELDRQSVRVESTVPLPAESRASIQESLARRYGPGLTYQFGENPALIGGVRIRVGTDVYDGTVQGRLAELEKAF